MAACSPRDGLGELEVCSLTVEDIPAFLQLQDELVDHHVRLTQLLYPKVCFRDWQLCIQATSKVLDAEGGRQRQLEAIAGGSWPTRLRVLKAVCHPYRQEPLMVGYIMYETHGGLDRPGVRRLFVRQEPPSVHVLQVFVAPTHRRTGCGHLLFQRMLEQLSAEEQRDITLEVLDLNHVAISWYRSLGFVPQGMTTKFLGDRKLAQLVAYQEMHCGRIDLSPRPPHAVDPSTCRSESESEAAAPAQTSAPPRLFKNEVLQEQILVYFPDRPGQHEGRILAYDRIKAAHCIGLPLENGEERRETIDLNQFYRDGRVQFKRFYSAILRDKELLGRARVSSRKRQLAELAPAHIMTRSKRKCSKGDIVSPGSSR